MDAQTMTVRELILFGKQYVTHYSSITRFAPKSYEGRSGRIGEIGTRTAKFIDDAVLKQDWRSDSFSPSLEQEHQNPQTQFRKRRHTSPLTLSQYQKLHHSKQPRIHEHRRNCSRHELFHGEDAIDSQQEDLIARPKKQLHIWQILYESYAGKWEVL